VPVGVVLIVDQQHVNRVLAAFANSNLRLVITQVLQTHYPGSVQPQLIKAPDINVRPIPGRGGQEGFIQPPFGQPIYGQQQGAEEQEANVELVIYGIMTLYERHPPKVLEPDEQAPAAPVPIPMDPNIPQS
jgi:hypothetical protein